MDRAYDDIPRQGEHRTGRMDEEPTTNVRGQDPPHPLDRSKTTREIIQLLANEDQGTYRLVVRPKDGGGPPETGYSEVASVPVGGDVGALLDRIPEPSRYAVFESTTGGTVRFDEDRLVTKDWAAEGVYDQVTVFREMDAASTYAKERHEASGGE